MPTPKSVVAALDPSPSVIAGISLPPITPLHVMALERVGSPFVVQARINLNACVVALTLLRLPAGSVLAAARECLEHPSDFDLQLADIANAVGFAGQSNLADAITAHISAPYELLKGAKDGDSNRPLPRTPAVG